MARQLDIVANPDAEDAQYRPYLVVLQSDLVANLRSTVVAPLVPRGNMIGARQLNPLVTVDGREYWIAAYELFAIEQRMLGPRVASVEDRRDAIIAAIDFLFTGF
jgi:toxin CcdB